MASHNNNNSMAGHVKREQEEEEEEEEEEEGCGLSDFLKAIEDSDEEEGAEHIQRVKLSSSHHQPATPAASATANTPQIPATQPGERQRVSSVRLGGGGSGYPSRVPAPFFQQKPSLPGGGLRGGGGGGGESQEERDVEEDARNENVKEDDGELSLRAIRAIDKEERDPRLLTSILDAGPGDGGRIAKVEPLDTGLDGFVVDGLLSPTECTSLIKATEELGFTFWNPGCERKDFRNADTVEVTNQRFADMIWDRLKHLVPPSVTIQQGSSRYSKELEGTWVATGLNPNMLFNRYPEGGHFSPHTDGYTIIDFNTRSMYSTLIYLNQCVKGGATRMMEESGEALQGHEQERFVKDDAGRHRFPDCRIRQSVSPEPGRALLFFQDTLHEGEPVGEGCEKYMIRTDVIYRRDPVICDSEQDREAYRMFREAELTEPDDPDQAMRLYRACSKLSPSLAAIYGL